MLKNYARPNGENFSLAICTTTLCLHRDSNVQDDGSQELQPIFPPLHFPHFQPNLLRVACFSLDLSSVDSSPNSLSVCGNQSSRDTF